MIAMLEAAAFQKQAIDEHKANLLIDQAEDLLQSLK